VVRRGKAGALIDEVVGAGVGRPLFLDPCGLTLPFEQLVQVLATQRRPTRGTWPPTELLMNFSMTAVRRLGGNARSDSSHHPALGDAASAYRTRWPAGGRGGGGSDAELQGDRAGARLSRGGDHDGVWEAVWLSHWCRCRGGRRRGGMASAGLVSAGEVTGRTGDHDQDDGGDVVRHGGFR
jgi:hypothetical protein